MWKKVDFLGISLLSTVCLFGYIGLKCFGIIHSPIWVNMLPYVFGGTSMLSLAFAAGSFSNRLKEVENDTEDIAKSIKSMQENCVKAQAILNRVDERTKK